MGNDFRHLRKRARCLVSAVCLCLLHALAASGDVILSPDVSISIAGVDLADGEIAFDYQSGHVWPAGLGLPDNSAVDGYHMRDDGTQLFSLEVTTALAGGAGHIVAEPADVVSWDQIDYAIAFDASAHGVPAGVNVDAVSETDMGDFVLSFSTTVMLGGLLVEDEDLVRFDGRRFSMLFDGSAQGVAAGLDLDGADVPDGLVVSFDGSGLIGGAFFDDEDALSFEAESGSWRVVYDGSAEHPSWPSGGDVDALVFVPEPGAALMLVSGVGLLGVLHRRHGSLRAGG
jgi:hypothetical protein